MAAVYGVLGLVVVLTGSKFGALNASWIFNAAIAVVFVVLALAMFDVFTIDLSRLQGRVPGAGARGGSFAVAFFMGAVAALLAGACVAPVVISVLLLSTRLYAAGVTAALLLPFVLGAGMGLPWPFLGAGLSFLPKPGRWMERVKAVFGVLILGFAVYYGLIAYRLARPRPAPPPAAIAADGWHHDLVSGLSAAAETGRPALLDFWATWCKNCKAMDRTTLKDPVVVERLSGFVRIKVQAENVNAPATRAVMDRFGVVGLPTYVVLLPHEG
jgi:thiol:disulfide interchange protein